MRARLVLPFLMALACPLRAAPADADERCARPLQDDVCAEATGSCPAVAPPLGLAAGPCPVVNPGTGLVYVGFDTGLFAVGPAAATPNATMLFPSHALARERIQWPPALDTGRGGGRLYVGARRGNRSTLYALDLAGNVLWKRPTWRRPPAQHPVRGRRWRPRLSDELARRVVAPTAGSSPAPRRRTRAQVEIDRWRRVLSRCAWCGVRSDLLHPRSACQRRAGRARDRAPCTCLIRARRGRPPAAGRWPRR